MTQLQNPRQRLLLVSVETLVAERAPVANRIVTIGSRDKERVHNALLSELPETEYQLLQ